MNRGLGFGAVCLLAFAPAIHAQETTPIREVVPLRVEAGTPLRLYITKRVWYRVGEPVTAILIEPIWAFDRIVIPAGSSFDGRVAKLHPVSRLARTEAIVKGDFTPLKRAEVVFTACHFPDGTRRELQTEGAFGMVTIYVPPRPPKKNAKPPKAPGTGMMAKAKQQIQAQIATRTGGVFEFVRGPNRREWAENYIMTKLPYHPQWYRSRTRFDALVQQPLDFGTASLDARDFSTLGGAPPTDSNAQMRIVQTVSSMDARVGDPLQGVLTQPLFTSDHHLVLPQGTRLNGRITLTQHARMFRRGGKLRFALENVQLPPAVAALTSQPIDRPSPVQAQLVAAEGNPSALKVDQEGTAKATESKTRLLRPVIAALVAAKSNDNDAGRQSVSGSGTGNASGRALGGFSGFGLLGTIASRGPRQIGTALGYYGLAWSIFSNVISRGSEVVLEKNSEAAVRFGSSTRPR